MPVRAVDLAGDVRGDRYGIATAVVRGGQRDVHLSPGEESFSERTRFEIGSITKTITALLLAQSVIDGVVGLDTTVGDILGPDGGNASGLTLESIATHHSGLPRLPVNLDLKTIDQTDPYAAYGSDDLIEGLAKVELGAPEPLYSNLGYMLLGELLGRVLATSYAAAVAARIFEPLGMTEAIVALPGADGSGRVAGYRANRVVPRWQHRLAGAGGVEASITDMVKYAEACLNPDSTPLGAALRLALTPRGPFRPGEEIGLAWVCDGPVRWHNGGTGGFHSHLRIHREAGCAVVVLAACSEGLQIDEVAKRTLDEVAAGA